MLRYCIDEKSRRNSGSKYRSNPGNFAELTPNRRQELHRVAPGYNPSSLLMPLSAAPSVKSPLQDVTQPLNPDGSTSPQKAGGTDLMDDLVSGLERMENGR